jgi:hypothetical protein
MGSSQALFNLAEGKWATVESPQNVECATNELSAEQVTLRQRCLAVKGQVMQDGCTSDSVLYCTRDPYQPQRQKIAAGYDPLVLRTTHQPNFHKHGEATSPLFWGVV